MKVRIIGTGSWASALCQVLADNRVDAMMIGVDKNEVDDINLNHRNSKYFDVEINNDVRASLNYDDVKDADIILLAVPSKVISSVVDVIYERLNKKVIVINVAKGFDYDTKIRLSEIIRKHMKDKLIDVVSLIGPSHAEEVILRLLTSVNAVCVNLESAKIIQELFSNNYFRVYRNDDEIGAEIGSAIKNIMAIASGILQGLKQGDNAKAALMTRGLAEMCRYGLFFNARKETFLGLNGVGDLIVTCSSYHSRNFQAGLCIGKNNSAKEFLESNTKTVEGINACKIVYEIAKENNIDMPITNAVYQVLFEEKKPSEAVSELMKRELKKEFF